MQNVTRLCALAITSSLTLTLACSSKSGSGDLVGSSKTKKNSSAEQAKSTPAVSDAQPGADASAASATPATATEAQAPVVVAPQATTPAAPAAPSAAEKYPDYKAPSAAYLADPARIKVYNYLNDEAIVSMNGRTLASRIAPGGVFTMPKLYDDIDAYGSYTVSLKTDKGRVITKKFKPMDVDQDAWRASLSDVNGQLLLEQNAGGGGGGGDQLNNFL